jgi:signal transduction histidine kinase
MCKSSRPPPYLVCSPQKNCVCPSPSSEWDRVHPGIPGGVIPYATTAIGDLRAATEPSAKAGGARGRAPLACPVFFGVLPFAHLPVGRIDAFLPIVATIMFLTDSITAILLYAQFAVLRSRALLVLANGYLFTALIAIPYALTFPGAFTPDGLLGAGLQSAGWLFVIWHIGLPTTVIGYTLLSNAPPEMQLARASVPLAMLASIVAIIILVCGLTWFVTAHEDLLPVLVLNLVEVSGLKSVTLTVLFLCITAILLLWIWRRSMLDLWLQVVSLAWLLDSIFMYLTESRYTIVWYANRIFGISSASFVLYVLLAESMMLYARLALSVLAQQGEREGRLMSLDAMSAAIAHQIKQPLGAIVANANAGQRWLRKIPPSLDVAGDTFKELAADGHRANEAIQSVRALFSRSEQVRTRLNTNEFLRETIALARSELEAVGIAVELDLAAQIPLILAHRGQLQQVILNIVDNAKDAMLTVIDRTRVLRMKSRPVGPNSVEVTVEDSGTGIQPKDIERIFEAFFTTKANGMGMGLALCRSIVEAHGGSLSVSPVVPHGSAFRVVLPSNR